MSLRAYAALAASTLVCSTLVAAGTEAPATAAPAAASLASVGAAGQYADVGTATRLAALRVGTKMHRVTPLTSRGRLRPQYSVRATTRGSCWTSSFLHGRAYRCATNRSYIQEACWKEAGRHSVVCPSEPWSSRVLRLRLTKRLPNTSSYGGQLWGLHLGSGIGVNCRRASGATGWIGDRPMSFYCRKGWVLVGNPDRQRPVWTIATAKRVGGHYELRGRKKLTAAWRPAVR